MQVILCTCSSRCQSGKVSDSRPTSLRTHRQPPLIPRLGRRKSPLRPRALRPSGTGSRSRAREGVAPRSLCRRLTHSGGTAATTLIVKSLRPLSLPVGQAPRGVSGTGIGLSFGCPAMPNDPPERGAQVSRGSAAGGATCGTTAGADGSPFGNLLLSGFDLSSGRRTTQSHTHMIISYLAILGKRRAL